MCSCCILADWNLFSSAFSWRRWQPEPVDLEMVDLESEEMEVEDVVVCVYPGSIEIRGVRLAWCSNNLSVCLKPKNTTIGDEENGSKPGKAFSL